MNILGSQPSLPLTRMHLGGGDQPLSVQGFWLCSDNFEDCSHDSSEPLQFQFCRTFFSLLAISIFQIMENTFS